MFLLFYIIFIATFVRHRSSLRELVFPYPLSLSANPEMTIDHSGIGPGERIMHGNAQHSVFESGQISTENDDRNCRFSAHRLWVPFCMDFRAMSSGQRT